MLTLAFIDKEINETIAEQYQFPIDILITKKDEIKEGWQWDSLNIIKQPHTEIWDLSHTNGLNLTENKLLCMDYAVTWSHKPKLFSGPDCCYNYRKKVFDNLGLPMAHARGGPLTETNKHVNYRVVIDNRDTQRGIVNIKQVEALLKHYDLNYTIARAFPYGTGLRPQVELLSDVDVYVVIHGAGETNVMFMPPRSVLIEIFPYGFQKQNFYHLSEVCGLFYESVHSRIKVNSSKILYDEDWWKTCQHEATIDHAYIATCYSAVKNSESYVPIREFEDKLLSAYNSMGVPLQNRATSHFWMQEGDSLVQNDFYAPSNMCRIPTSGTPNGACINGTWVPK